MAGEIAIASKAFISHKGKKSGAIAEHLSWKR